MAEQKHETHRSTTSPTSKATTNGPAAGATGSDLVGSGAATSSPADSATSSTGMVAGGATGGVGASSGGAVGGATSSTGLVAGGATAGDQIGAASASPVSASPVSASRVSASPATGATSTGPATGPGSTGAAVNGSSTSGGAADGAVATDRAADGGAAISAAGDISRRYLRPTKSTNVFNNMVAFITRCGISILGSRVLYVRGRKTGEWRSLPVNLLTIDGQRYLVSPRGHSQWVRNLRATGHGELRVGRRVERFVPTELGDDDKPAILRAYLRRWKFEVGMFFEGVDAKASDEVLRGIAPGYPVFRITTRHD